jgi:Carboxypeptidase regulatory-like domain
MCTHNRAIVWCDQKLGRCLFLFLVLTVAFSPALYAQLSSASVTGIVRDPTGGVIIGANGVLRNVDTGVERTTVTNSAGNYLLLNVNPGRYTLEMHGTGFKSSKVSEFTLAVSQAATFDITLEIGGLEQTVTVGATVAEIESSTAQLGSVVAEKQVVDLPLNGRNFTQLLSLAPGVAPVSVSQNSGGFSVPTTQGSQFVFPAINGQTSRSNFFMLDGISDQNDLLSAYVVPPIIDAIQEFKVVSHSDLAEFGSSTGGIVNVVTKSGTNGLHGTAWEYLRNDAFDARNTFQDKVTTFRQNQFGFSVGGPVWIPKLYNGKNRTFFYGAFQQFLYRRPSNSFFRVPTEANYNGDLSDIPTQIYNPFTTREDPAHPGNFIRDPFPNNQIPVSLFDQSFLAYAKATLPAAGPKLNGDNNAIDPTPLHQDQQEYTFRVDQTIGRNDSAFFRYSAIENNTSSSGGRPGITIQHAIPGTNWGLNYVHIFSPSLVLQAQYGRVKSEDNNVTAFPGLPASVLQAMNFNSQFAGNFGGFEVVPVISVPGFFSGGAYGLTNPSITNSHQFRGNVSKVSGTHTLKFGAEFASLAFEENWYQSNLNYAAQQTGNPSNSSEPGSALASFLLNVPNEAIRYGVGETTRPGGVLSWYVQDSWKATSKLTVNIGLRFDRTFRPPYGRNDTYGKAGGIETGDMNFNNGTYVLQKLPPPCSERGFAPCMPGDGSLPAHVVVDPRGKIQHDINNWGPRLGLAYRLGSKTVIRASGGIFYDNFAGVNETVQNIQGSWPGVGQQIAENLNVPRPGQPLPTVRGNDPFAGTGGLFPAPTPFNTVQYYYDPLIKNPYAMQWNFGVERQINNSTTLSVSYVGSGTRRLDIGGYYNVALTPGPGDPRERSLYPYIAATNYDRSIGKSSYNGLQAMLNKRFSKGLAYQVAYTWSKSLDYCSSEWYGADSQNCTDPYNVNGSHGNSGYDLTHVLSINALYELPIGKGKRFQTKSKFADYILGNWQLNSIFLARSGLPYQVYVSGDVANTGSLGWAQYERANLVGGADPYVSHVSPDNGLNRAAFTIPDIYTFGNLGRNRLRTVPFWNMDFSVFRQFPFFESRRIEFRAEAFNVLNTVIYGQPSNDMADPASFGRIFGTANSPRSLQLGAKIIF